MMSHVGWVRFAVQFRLRENRCTKSQPAPVWLDSSSAKGRACELGAIPSEVR